MRLVISCPTPHGRTRGGLFTLDTDTGDVKRRADFHTIGLARMPYGYITVVQHTELLRIDRDFEVISSQPYPVWGGLFHDILPWRDEQHLIVDTAGNRVAVMAPNPGQTTWFERGEYCPAPGAAFDACHLNCICVRDLEIYATAYGLFNAAQEWRRRPQEGVLLDLNRGRVLLGKLDKPHTPRLVGNAGALCESGASALLEFARDEDDKFAVTRRTVLRGFTRGLLAHDGGWFVGLSDSRYGEKEGDAEIAYVKDGREERAWKLPAQEIYDIVEAHPS